MQNLATSGTEQPGTLTSESVFSRSKRSGTILLTMVFYSGDPAATVRVASTRITFAA